MINMILVTPLNALVIENSIRDILTSMHLHGAWNRWDTDCVLIIITVVSSWITGIRMRRKISKDLGRKATEADLTSIATWMDVDEAEERKKRNTPLSPD
jgi:hypothetical protein